MPIDKKRPDPTAATVNEELLGEVEKYINEHYERITTTEITCCSLREESAPIESAMMAPRSIDGAGIDYLVECMADELPALREPQIPIYADVMGIDDLIDNLDESFSTTLLRLIRLKGKTEVEVYKRANLDRKHFSKIRTGKGYTPRKRTVIALAIALKLNLDETNSLLERAGYTISHSYIFDVIVEYFIVNGRYDIFEINNVLFKYDQPLLGP